MAGMKGMAGMDMTLAVGTLECIFFSVNPQRFGLLRAEVLRIFFCFCRNMW